jgi:hypothetical protein
MEEREREREREGGNILIEFKGGDRVGKVGWSWWRREEVRQRQRRDEGNTASWRERGREMRAKR